MTRTALCLVIGLVLIGAFVPGRASSEMYIAGQVGYAAPYDLSITGTGPSSGINSSDLSLEGNVAAGAKIGGYFPGALKWLGVEVEGFYDQPNIKTQAVTPTQSVNGTTLKVGHFAVNAMLRYPGERFQPYIGVGPGVNWASISGNTTFSGETSTTPALNVLAGLRLFITERFALFGEFKYNQSAFKFNDNGIDATYRTTMFMAGLSFHFK